MRTALSHLSANETWLLQAVPVPRRAQRASGRGAPTKAAMQQGGGPIWRVYWRSSRAHSGRYEPVLDACNILSGMERPLERADELEKKWRRQTEQLRKMQEDHMKQFEEQRKKAELSRPSKDLEGKTERRQGR